MLNVKLEDIIINREFGPVQIGSAKAEVVQLLGEPDGVSNPEVFPENYESVIYDWFEFTFNKGLLERFHHKSILTRDYKFNANFNYKNEKFSVSHWFKNLNEDLKLNNVRNWLMMKELNFIEEPFYDSIRVIVDSQVELQFHSKLAYHKYPEEWQKDSPENLNWQLGAFYVTSNKTKYNKT